MRKKRELSGYKRESFGYRRKYGLLTAAAYLAFLLSACAGAQTAPAGTAEESTAAEESGMETAGGGEAADTSAAQTASPGETGSSDMEETETSAAEETEFQGETETESQVSASGLENWLTEDGYLNLAVLQEINADIYAWLDIPGTDISFPLLQSAEDEYYYLSHNESKEEDDAGCIYTEYFNRKDFSDPNTVIYGRNVEGRFALLHQFQDRDFFDTYRTVNIYLEDRVLSYEIFAAYNYDDRHLIKIYDFWDKDIFADYLETVFSQRAMDAYVDDSIEVTADDKIITLSTGVTGQDDRRYLVQAVQIS